MNPQPLFAAMSRRVTRDGLVFFRTALESPQHHHVFEYNWVALNLFPRAWLTVRLNVPQHGGISPMSMPLMSFQEVRETLQQRFPLIMVDTVISLEPGKIFALRKT